jgi:hypothetical protein
MNTLANVQSTEAVEATHAGLVSFVAQVQDALDSLDLEMRRVLDWLEHDRPRYWKSQTRLAVDQANEAQAALHRCLMYPIAGERPACAEERAALKRAKARLVTCEEKQRRVQHWIRTVRHELMEYEGRISQLARLVEIEAPEAIGVLNKILLRLEEYRSIRLGAANTYNDVALVAELWPGQSAEKEPVADQATVGADRFGEAVSGNEGMQRGALSDGGSSGP